MTKLETRDEKQEMRDEDLYSPEIGLQSSKQISG